MRITLRNAHDNHLYPKCLWVLKRSWGSFQEVLRKSSRSLEEAFKRSWGSLQEVIALLCIFIAMHIIIISSYIQWQWIFLLIHNSQLRIYFFTQVKWVTKWYSITWPVCLNLFLSSVPHLSKVNNYFRSGKVEFTCDILLPYMVLWTCSLDI